MLPFVKPIAEYCASILEILGVGVIVFLALYSLGYGVMLLVRRVDGTEIFQRLRHRMVRGILLGLELLVGADIIHTVAIDLTFQTVGILAAIVVIRTFLSFTLEVEMTGHWPWNPSQEKG